MQSKLTSFLNFSFHLMKTIVQLYAFSFLTYIAGVLEEVPAFDLQINLN